MTDLISRQAAIETLITKVFHELSDEFYGTMQVLEELPSVFIRDVDAPTIDPVKHGKWKNKQMLDEELNPTIAFRHRCSECGFEICTTDETIWWHFCPNCGAKVDGGEG